jgi:hypothetical protein
MHPRSFVESRQQYMVTVRYILFSCCLQHFFFMLRRFFKHTYPVMPAACRTNVSPPSDKDPLPPLVGVSFQKVAHAWAKEEFERQIFFGHLSKVKGATRYEHYFYDDAQHEDTERRLKQELNESVKDIQWTGPDDENDATATTHGAKVDCDFYIRFPEGTVLSSVFYPVVDIAWPQSLPDAWFSPMEQPGCVLCEIAEKPELLRAKVFQLLKAMRCGPFQGENAPVLAFVCVNGDEGKARAAAGALFAGLRHFNGNGLETLEGVPLVVGYGCYGTMDEQKPR